MYIYLRYIRYSYTCMRYTHIFAYCVSLKSFWGLFLRPGQGTARRRAASIYYVLHSFLLWLQGGGVGSRRSCHCVVPPTTNKICKEIIFDINKWGEFQLLQQQLQLRSFSFSFRARVAATWCTRKFLLRCARGKLITAAYWFCTARAETDTLRFTGQMETHSLFFYQFLFFF